MKYDEAIRKYRDTLCVMQSQLDEGIQIGIEKGRQQTQASIARNLKAQHVPLDVIASSTGLSIQEIENLS